MQFASPKILLLSREKGEQFSWSQNGSIFNPKFAIVNSPRVRKQSRMEKFGRILSTEKLLFFQWNMISRL